MKVDFEIIMEVNFRFMLSLVGGPRPTQYALAIRGDRVKINHV